MNILVTGGAGYVGSVVAETLLRAGYEVIILDNLQQGHQEAIPRGARFFRGDIRETKTLDNVFQRNRVDAVMHLAAETVVEYSMTDPRRYFHNNIIAGVTLLDTMLKHGVHKLVFSSSAAVYGEPKEVPIVESHPRRPVNAYGETKLMFEKILKWYGKAYGLKHISFRYFNAAGATKTLGEDHHPESHLIPNVLSAVLNNDRPVEIYGTDYPTDDGSCVRDYVHVVDIARAHMMGLEKIEQFSGRVYNLGTGRGNSVLEVVAAAVKVARARVHIRMRPRRAGDPAALVASAARVQSEIGWQPAFPDLGAIIESAWQWLRDHPNGYASTPVKQTYTEDLIPIRRATSLPVTASQ